MSASLVFNVVFMEVAEKQHTLRFEKTSTLVDFFVALNKVLDAPRSSEDLGKHTFLNVEYGKTPKNVTEALRKVDNESAEWQSLIANRSTMIIVLPVSKRSPIQRFPQSDDKEEETNFSERRKAMFKQYEKMTVDGALEVLSGKKRVSRRQKRQVESFVDVYAQKVLASDAVTKLSDTQFAALISRDGLNCSEVCVWKALMAWGKARVKKDKDTLGRKKYGAAIRKEVDGLMKHVRFPFIEAVDFAKSVQKANVLTSGEKVEYFMLSQAVKKKKGKVKARSLKCNMTPRKPKRGPPRFVFDPLYAGSNIVISEFGSRIGSSNTSHKSAVADEGFSKGVHEFTVEVKDCTTSSYNIVLGVVSQQSPGNYNTSPRNQSSWGEAVVMTLYDGNAWVNRSSRSVGFCRVNKNESVKVRVDMDKREVTYTHLQKSKKSKVIKLGSAKTYYPVVALYGRADIKFTDL